MPANAGIPAAAIPARPHVTRAFVSDTSLMQRPRKKDVPAWLWSTGTSIVLVIIAVLLAIIGWGLNRVGRLSAPHSPPTVPRLRRRPAIGSAPTRAPAGAGR